MPRGRRDKLTDEVQEIVVQAISLGASYEIAAQYAGIRRETVWRWLKRGENERQGRFRTFANAVRAAEGKCAVQALAAIKSAAKDSWQAAAWLMERRYADQYGRTKLDLKTDGTIKHEHSGSLGFDYSKYTNEELIALEQLLAKQEAPPPTGDDAGKSPGGEGT